MSRPLKLTLLFFTGNITNNVQYQSPLILTISVGDIYYWYILLRSITDIYYWYILLRSITEVYYWGLLLIYITEIYYWGLLLIYITEVYYWYEQEYDIWTVSDNDRKLIKLDISLIYVVILWPNGWLVC